MTMSGVHFRNVRKEFGGAVAVEDLTLDILPGEFLSLLGPSGCGKTTTLRMLAGLEQPTRGTISIGERDVTELTPARRNIAMVFQSYALYPHMTVAQNIEYPLKKHGVARDERARRVRETLDLLGLGPLGERKPRQLSGGQQQRVALGRAIVRSPEVFLLDEPLSNLDAKLRGHMRAELIQLQRRLGKTMIYVTHDQLEAMTMSDRIAIMSKGVLQQLATPDAIYRRPVNLFVAGFVGTPGMTFIEGEIGAGPSFVSSAVTVPLPADHPARAAATVGRKVVAGIRPEDVLPDPAGIPAEVAVVEPTGHESIVFYRVGALQLVGRVDAERRLKPGDTAGVMLRAMNLHLFDARDERRLDA
jgi:multiple sugar transport system ATP-binding protein